MEKFEEKFYNVGLDEEALRKQLQAIVSATLQIPKQDISASAYWSMSESSPCTLIFEAINKEHLICCHFKITEFPGNHNLAISSAMNIGELYRHHGLGKALMRFKLSILNQAGIKMVLATAREDNIPERTILRNNKFNTIAEIESNVYLWSKRL